MASWYRQQRRATSFPRPMTEENPKNIQVGEEEALTVGQSVVIVVAVEIALDFTDWSVMYLQYDERLLWVVCFVLLLATVVLNTAKLVQTLARWG